MISVNNPNCQIEIEQVISTENNTLTQTTSYVQKTKTFLPQSEYDKLQRWMDYIEPKREFKRFPNIKTDGVVFNDGSLDNNVKQIMYYNKDNALRKKFEKEHQQKYGDDKNTI